MPAGDHLASSDSHCAPAAQQPAPSPVAPIGRPVSLITGHFAGRTIRAELDMLQHADVGRQCTTEDQCPLDLSPVARLRLFEVAHPGTPLESEHELLDLTELNSYGFLCYADLFRVPDQQTRAFNSSPAPPSGGPRASSLPTPIVMPLLGLSTRVLADHTSGPLSSNQMAPLIADPLPAYVAPSSNVTGGGMASYYPAIVGPEPMRISVADPHSSCGAAPPCCTELLVGTTFVAPTFIQHEGKKMVFAFAGLAVEEDGLYFVRYRAFNIFSIAVGRAPMPVLAECYGDAFRVYGAKELPDLRTLTELTKAGALHRL